MEKTLFILMVVFCCKISFAQTAERQVIGSTGNLTNSGNILATSTTGEAVILTYSQATLVVTQGFQQPISTATVIDIFTGVNDIEPEGTNISAYPNPTMNEVILDFTLKQSMDIGIDIYNEAGQQMRNHLQRNVQNNFKQELNFADFATGNYFIVVKSTDGKLFRSFKVQKIN